MIPILVQVQELYTLLGEYKDKNYWAIICGFSGTPPPPEPPVRFHSGNTCIRTRGLEIDVFGLKLGNRCIRTQGLETNVSEPKAKLLEFECCPNFREFVFFSEP